MAAKARLRLDGADPINRGLFAFWPLQENAGLSVEDIGPQGKVGRITGAPLRVVTNKGRALRFDASNTQNVDTGLLLGAPSAGTITWWQRSTQAYNSGDLDRVPWGNASDSGAGANFTCQVFFFDNNWYVGWLNGTDYRVTLAASASNWPQNEWAFYAFTWGPAGSVLYQNNAVVLGSNATPPVTAESGYNFALARIGPNYYTASHFAGDLMAFRVHTRVLRIPEIQRLYRDPWAGTARPVRRAVAVPGTPHTAAPGAGTETYAGQGATVKAGATLLPGAGAETYSGKQAAVTAGATVAVGAGTETYQGLGAGVTQPATVAVGAGLVEVLGLQAALGSGLSGRVVRRGRYRTWDDVPTELAPVVALAENYADELAVQRAVNDALARFAAMKAKTSIARRERLVGDLKRAIVAAVEEAAEADDEDALIALL